jgi:hypothetical protein
MRQFREDELMDGAPTCDGCRRVIEDTIGIIASSVLPKVFPPSRDNNGTSTVSVRVKLWVTNKSHPLNGQFVECEEIADVNRSNTDHPYHKYASATAASRAEGRALRKLLRLRNTYTAEEVSERAESADDDCDWEADEPITDSQISVLTTLCQRLDIDVMDFVNSGRNTYDNIHAVSKSTAQSMLRELNKIQRQAKPRPENLKPYNPNWNQKGDN